MIRAIVFDILAPILVLVALGALLRRRFALHIPTLTKLNIYLFVPAFIFHVVSRGTLTWGEMGGVMLVTALNVVTLGLVVWGIGRVLRVSRGTLSAVALAVMFYNSGNYGLPLAALAFPGSGGGAGVRDGAAVQAFVVFAMNILTFTVGLTIAVPAGAGHWSQGVKTFLRLPMLPTIAAALGARWWLQGAPGRQLPVAIAKSAEYLADGLIPLALVTLGAQLADNPRRPRWKPVSLIVFLRLIYGPAQMALLLWGLHLIRLPMLDLWGRDAWPAASLVLTAGVPTAVNTLLMVLEVGGEADLAADAVFWTTVASCVTITGWLVVIRTWL